MHIDANDPSTIQNFTHSGSLCNHLGRKSGRKFGLERTLRPLFCILLAYGVFGVGVADAQSPSRGRKRASTKRADGSKSASVRSRKNRREKSKWVGLLGDFEWGMSSANVLDALVAQLKKRYAKRIAAEPEPLKQDKLRQEMQDKIRDVRKSAIRFTGKISPWDISLIDEEFAHRNDESVVVTWGAEDRRFFFFHKDRLWKIYIAFNADRYEGKTFSDFSGIMERRYGSAERKYEARIKGPATISHLEWKGKGRTVLRAIDNTAFFGNFCLVLVDNDAAIRVKKGRRQHGQKAKHRNSLIDRVLRTDGKTQPDVNDDIIDRITGRPVKLPEEMDLDSP